jgi:hypothetical protein
MHELLEEFEDYRDALKDLRDAALIVILFIGCIALVIMGINHLLHPDSVKPVIEGHVISVARGQEVVLEHSNADDATGNIIYVYCDLPSFDRIYVVNRDHVTVEPGGCKGLP